MIDQYDEYPVEVDLADRTGWLYLTDLLFRQTALNPSITDDLPTG